MLDAEDIKWVKSTANELNNLLLVISESSQFLETILPHNSDTQKYFDMLRNGVDRATQVSKAMLNRVDRTGSSITGGNISPFPLPGEFARPVFEAPKVAPVPAPAPAAAAPAGGEYSGIKIVNPEGSRELILIVDDEDFVNLLAQRVLTDEGYRVVSAKDGFQAIELYKKLQDKINLVLLDFTMPIMDGAEVFDELRMINPRVPVVLSSGFTEQDRLKTMLSKGLRGFIPKPYTQQKLLMQVRSTLDAIKNQQAG